MTAVEEQVTVDDIIAAASLREEAVTLCVAGALVAEYETLDGKLQAYKEDGWNPAHLSDEDPRRAIRDRMDELSKEMERHKYTFRFRALPYQKWVAFDKAHTDPETGQKKDLPAFIAALVFACATDPTFRGPEHVQALFEKLTTSQVDDLFTGAWLANTGRADIPKSANASALMVSSEPKPKQPEATG